MNIKKFFPITAPPPRPAAAALRIVRAGGAVDCYYMAMPAKAILEKHGHSFVLAKPDVFRRPCREEEDHDDDPVVRHDEILVPGQKFYLVPRRTVKSLRRRNVIRAGKGRHGDDNNGKKKEEEEEGFSGGDGGVKAARKPPRIDNYLHPRRGHSRRWRPSLAAIAENGCS